MLLLQEPKSDLVYKKINRVLESKFGSLRTWGGGRFRGNLRYEHELYIDIIIAAQSY